MGQSTAFRKYTIIPWVTETANANLRVNRGVFASSGGTIQLLLPMVSAVGDVVAAVNVGGQWRITQNAGQQVVMSGASTTTGGTGYLESTLVGDAVYLVCAVANTTWHTISVEGILTVV